MVLFTNCAYKFRNHVDKLSLLMLSYGRNDCAKMAPTNKTKLKLLDDTLLGKQKTLVSKYESERTGLRFVLATRNDLPIIHTYMTLGEFEHSSE